MNKFSNELSNLRKQKNLTQKQLGEIIGVSDKQISKWEKGELLPSMENVQKLAEFFGVSFQEILTGEKLEENIVIPKRIQFSIFSILLECICFVLILVSFVLLLIHKGNTIDLHNFNGEYVTSIAKLVLWIEFLIASFVYLTTFITYLVKFKLRVPYGKPLEIVMIEKYVSDSKVIKRCYQALGELICLMKIVIIGNICPRIIINISGIFLSSSFMIYQAVFTIIFILTVYIVYLNIFKKNLKSYIPKKI